MRTNNAFKPGLYYAPQPHKNMIAYETEVGKTMACAVPKILLIDDDPIFSAAFSRVAKKLQVPIKAYASFEEYDEASQWDYELVIMDYDLGNINGVEFSEYIESTIGDVPTLLVSYSDRNFSGDSAWPKIIRDFSTKGQGIHKVFDDALRVYATSTKT